MEVSSGNTGTAHTPTSSAAAIPALSAFLAVRFLFAYDFSNVFHL
jgi:hypothetical protein